jgi:hypothetical protein
MTITARLSLLCALVAVTTAKAEPSSSCLIVRDFSSAQDVRIEAHGANAVRVRAVLQGSPFKDEPDIISALLAKTDSASTSNCTVVTLPPPVASVVPGSKTNTTLKNGNLEAAVGSDGRLRFTRVSDGKLLLTEKAVRALRPTTTVPPLPGFLSLDLSFQPVEGMSVCPQLFALKCLP